MKMSGPTTILFVVFGVLQMSCISGSVSIRELWRSRRIDKRFIPTIFKKLITRRFPTRPIWLATLKRRNIVNLNEHVDPSKSWLSGVVPARRKSTAVMDNVYRDPQHVFLIDSARHSGLMGSYGVREPHNRGQRVKVPMEADVRPSLLNYNHLQQVAHSQTDWLRKFPCELEDPYDCFNYSQFYYPIGSDIGESNVPVRNNFIGYYDNEPFSTPSEKRRTYNIFVDLREKSKRASGMKHSSKRRL